MKLAFFALLALGAVAVAEERSRRQVNYQFPGPRQGAPQDDSGLYQQRRQFQAQPVQSYGAAPAPAPRAAPQQNYGPPPQQAARRPAAASRTRYAADSQQDVEENPEEERGPDPLALLLQDSKFTCGAKKDGYYADNSVNCQAFHYCVAGAKHSWMCPAGTTFHQVHLNCVANNQDTTLCGQAEKFYFVNDYLHKELEARGPNNSVQYAQRYYPDGYTIGDTLVAPGAQQGGYQQGGYQQGGGGGGGDQYQQGPPPQGRPQASYGGPPPQQYRPQGPPPQQYARPSYPASAPPPQRPAYQPQAAAPAPRAAPPQSYGYGGSGGGVPNLDDVRIAGLPNLPQVPQAQPQPQPRRPQAGPPPNLASRSAAVQPYGGAYQVPGGRQVRYDDDRGY